MCHRRDVAQGVTSRLQIGEVARTVPLVYQPTLLPGGTMTRPEGVLLPQPLYTVYDGFMFTPPCVNLGRCTRLQNPKGRCQPRSCLFGGRVITNVIGNHIIP